MSPVIWVAIGVFVVFIWVFVLALCVAAANGDRRLKRP